MIKRNLSPLRPAFLVDLVSNINVKYKHFQDIISMSYLYYSLFQTAHQHEFRIGQKLKCFISAQDYPALTEISISLFYMLLSDVSQSEVSKLYTLSFLTLSKHLFILITYSNYCYCLPGRQCCEFKLSTSHGCQVGFFFN